MTQREFMQELVAALAEELPAGQVEEHRRFYESYFAEERRKGRQEEEILEELGDPRMIAMTLIDMAALRGQGGSGGNGYGTAGDDSGSGPRPSGGRGFTTGGGFSNGNMSRLGCGLGSLIGIALLVVLLSIIIIFLKFMLPVIAIVVIIGMILSIFRNS